MFDDLTVDELETELLARERVIGRLRAEQLELLRDLDAAQVAVADGCRTMVEWVSGRLDVDHRTASDLVDTSRLADTDLEASLQRGECAFDRTATTARLVATGADGETVAFSQALNLGAVRRLVASNKQRTVASEQEAFSARHLIIQPSLDESVWRLRGLLAGYDGRIVTKALLEEADRTPVDVDLPRQSRATRMADALTTVCARSLGESGSQGGGEPVITVHVDAHRLATTRGQAGITIDNGPTAGISLLEEALCTGRVELTATTVDGRPLAVGRTTRVISPRLRRFVLNRDHGCTAAGCTSRYRLQPHHVIPWSDGGRTDPDNLTTLCWYHHHVVVHGRGFRIDPQSPPHQRRLLNPHHRDPP